MMIGIGTPRSQSRIPRPMVDPPVGAPGPAPRRLVVAAREPGDGGSHHAPSVAVSGQDATVARSIQTAFS